MAELIIVIICLTLNGLFACFEMAFVTVGKPQLRQMAKGSSSALKILKLRENPERTLSVIQIGISFVGMISAAVGGAGAEESFAPVLEQKFGWSENKAEVVAIALVVIPLTFFSVVFGELVPKTLALRNPISISLFGARWIAMADRVFAPLVTVLEWSTKGVLSILPKKREVTVSSERGDSAIEIEHLSQPTQQYMLNLAKIEHRRVHDLMIDWPQVSKISSTDTRDSVVAAVVTSGHTRLPVVADDGVIGVLHTKEFIAMLATTDDNWQAIIRPALSIQDSALALATLRMMQAKRTNMAIIHKGDTPVGIVTLEDVIEEIVGDLFDEDDDGRIRKLLATTAKWKKR